jgi:hypothetical protein
MAGSDIKAVYRAADATGADPDGICESQTPAAGGVQNLTIDGALAIAGPPASFPTARIISITAVGNESARTFTITGTDVNGNAITETITGPNAGNTNGAKFFRTVSQVSVDDDTADAVTVGVTTAAQDVFYSGRARLRSIYIVRSATAGLMDLDTGADPLTAERRFRFSSPAAANTTESIYIPDEGILFEDGIYISYLSTGNQFFSSMTVMHS